jgi:pyruvate dehydrogenase E2 component (dihydrolipoamide acetyltransferase)
VAIVSTTEIRVPNIGDFKDVPVIDVLIKPGDRVKKEDPLITLESEKASMDVPSTLEGQVKDVKVKVGDKVSEGSVILTVEASEAAAAAAPAAPQAQPAASATTEIRVPNIGDFKDVPVIDVLVKPGDRVKKEDPLVTLESEKASMDVPSTLAGDVRDVKVKVGDKVSEGSVILTIETKAEAAPTATPQPPAAATPQPPSQAPPVQPAAAPVAAETPRDGIVYASPAIRKFARELGVDLRGLRGSGPHGRILREDVQRFVKSALQERPAAPAGGFAIAGLPAWPKVDFSQYGEIERVPLSRIKRLSGPNLHRNWLQIPHITNYDEADVTELEAFRNEINAEQTKSGGTKLTMLAFLVKACIAALQHFPDFNSSLDGEELVRKHYYNIGFAADTPNGLVVPVLKNADRKGLLEIAKESAELAGKARDGKLSLADMQGGTFTISSIGGIGGTQFTQIVNAPEVAILGATRTSTKPVWDGKEFIPRLILPISVSYDHRVIDGAGAARFLVYLASLLRDFKRVLL